jgi:hypothetical protein
MPIDNDDPLPWRVKAGGDDGGYEFESYQLTGRAGEDDYPYRGAGELMQRGVELGGSVEDHGGMTGIPQLHPNIHRGETPVFVGEPCGSRVGQLRRSHRYDYSGLLWVSSDAVSLSQADRRMPKAGRVDRMDGRAPYTDSNYRPIFVRKAGDGLT